MNNKINKNMKKLLFALLLVGVLSGCIDKTDEWLDKSYKIIIKQNQLLRSKEITNYKEFTRLSEIKYTYMDSIIEWEKGPENFNYRVTKRTEDRRKKTLY